MPEPRATIDGLPVVTAQTFLEVLQRYPIASADGDPVVKKRIKDENPQLYRIMLLGLEGAPTREARAYYRMGIEIVYELLRAESANRIK